MAMPEHDEHRAPLERAVQHAIKYLQEVQTGRATPSLSRDELRRQIDRPLPETGTDPVQIIDDLVADASGGLTGTGGGRFFGWVVGSALPAATAADVLAVAWDQNAALYAVSPAAAIVEETAGRWLKELLELPETASFALVPGCQIAHVTGLAAARHRLLERRGWDVEAKGLSGAPAIRVVTSTGRHGSSVRALKFLGLGTDCVTALPPDENGRLRPEDLEKALAEHPEAPTIVILQAGEINTGAFDDFEKLIPIAHRYGAWVHVDGAFGLWVRTSPTHRHHLDGYEKADSWATDGHKWLNVPYDSGYAFVADRKAHQAAMTHRASYLAYDEDAREEMDWNPEWSRRARAFATYAAIRELGRKGIGEVIDRTCRYAREIVEGIGKLHGAEIVHMPTINQGMVRFLDPQPGATEEDHDRRTDEVIAALWKAGDALLTGTTYQGRRCMRVSVCSYRTHDDDVSHITAALVQLLCT